MDVVKLFDAVADRMRSDLAQARSVLDHPGQKGSAAEEGFRQFLRDYLPGRFDVSTGTVVDSNGNASKQMDVIISDAGQTPVLFSSGENRVVPIEGVYAAIEIKSNLSADELEGCFNNMQSLRALSRDAQLGWGSFTYTYEMYGESWTDTWPAHFFVFAYDSASLKNLTAKLNELQPVTTSPIWKRIDTICVLNKGVIMNQLPSSMYGALPEPNSILGHYETDKALLLFYTLISHPLFQARKPPMEFRRYLGNMSFDPSH